MGYTGECLGVGVVLCIVGLRKPGPRPCPVHHTHTARHLPPAAPAGEGLPAGLQFLGRPFDEPTIIRLAYAYEQHSQQRRPPNIFPECRDPPGPAAEAAAASQSRNTAG
jgi:hypothetical protein